MRVDPLALRLLVAAAVCALAALALGLAVAHRPATRIDVAAFALRGHAVPLATALTTIGRGLGTSVLGVLALGVAFALHRGVRSVAIVIAAQLLSQAANAGLKLLFARQRPVEWLGYRETDLSFPSGHATTAVVFFTGLAVLAFAGLPRPANGIAGVVLCLVAGGIAWSRLALGAHYLTDVIGGALLGTAWLCCALAAIVQTASRAASSTG